MLMAICISLLSILCFAFSQLKHVKAVFDKTISDSKGMLLKVTAIGLLLVIQPILWQQPQVGLSYVIWLCWLSIWIVLTGLVLSYFSKRR